ncbi:MAG TPA: hypothetical protein VGH99_13115 [Pseudonocardia sp.]|jgi:hypothetical protein
MERNPRYRRRAARWSALAGVLATVLVLAGCGGSTSPQAPEQGGPAGAAAPTQANCTTKVPDASAVRQALAAANAGDTICVTGDSDDARLVVDKGGSDGSPITVLGTGKTAAKGITIEADNVVVDGFLADEPEAPGASILGSNVTLRNTTINRPIGDDYDGIRFWGNNIRILHNTITDTRNDNKAHADCMQTFATDDDHPASQGVLIDGNRCEKIANNCLIAEGPNSEAGDGSGDGESKNFTFSNNYCENKASQAVLADDIKHMVITGNQVVGRINHAWALQNESTDAEIRDNQVRSVKYEVGMDDSSEDGYQGPESGGGP